MPTITTHRTKSYLRYFSQQAPTHLCFRCKQKWILKRELSTKNLPGKVLIRMSESGCTEREWSKPTSHSRNGKFIAPIPFS